MGKGKGVGCWGSEKRGVGFEAETERGVFDGEGG